MLPTAAPAPPPPAAPPPVRVSRGDTRRLRAGCSPCCCWRLCCWCCCRFPLLYCCCSNCSPAAKLLALLLPPEADRSRIKLLVCCTLAKLWSTPAAASVAVASGDIVAKALPVTVQSTSRCCCCCGGGGGGGCSNRALLLLLLLPVVLLKLDRPTAAGGPGSTGSFDAPMLLLELRLWPLACCCCCF